jgi:membrane-bound metal-dependent hydrolase YbcI (DUF457 family)
MPLPLGHIAIGLATNDICSRGRTPGNHLVLALFIAVLAILPDTDLLIGLLLKGNAGAFHRGPTHSMVFALFMGFLACNAWRLSSLIPRVNFLNCFLIILSHVAADFFFTRSPVSMLWPLEVNWIAGYMGWKDIIIPVFLKAYQDTGIVLVCGVVILLNRLITQGSPHAFPGIWHNRFDKIQ